MKLYDAVCRLIEMAHIHVDNEDVEWKAGAVGRRVLLANVVKGGGVGGSGGDGSTIYIAEVISRSGSATYVVDVYTGFSDQPSPFSLPAEKLHAEDATLKTPFLDDTLSGDQLVAGKKLMVTTMSFTEGVPGSEVTYYVPFERIGMY